MPLKWKFVPCLFLLFTLQSALTAQTKKPDRIEITGSVRNDNGYRPRLKMPAFSENGPVILLDEGHQNAPFNEGFARLAAADGYQVRRSQSKFDTNLLREANILVVLEPGVTGVEKSPSPAFTEEEATAVHDWIAGGGALLFTLNGFAAGPHSILSKLGVEFNPGAVVDAGALGAFGPPGSVNFVFSGEQFLLASHKIILGRSAAEQVKKVVMGVGSMTIIQTKPEGAASLLHCSENAQFYPDWRQARAVAKSNGASSVHAGGPVRAPYAPIGIAFALGEGRIVVLGDARITSATVFRSGGEYEGLRQGDNQQFTLNVMHWLSRLME
jgi:hypothetical protein